MKIEREFPGGRRKRLPPRPAISERRITIATTCSSDLGVEVRGGLFAEHGITPDMIDFVLFCTQSPDYFLPSTACLVQDRLGIPQTAGALDFNLGSFWVCVRLGSGAGLIETGEAQHVLLDHADTYSKFLAPRRQECPDHLRGCGRGDVGFGQRHGQPGPFRFRHRRPRCRHLIRPRPVGCVVRQPVPAASPITDEFGNVSRR